MLDREGRGVGSVSGLNYFRGFNLYSYCRQMAGGGWVCLAISNSIPFTPIDLNTNLEAVACKVYFNNFTLHICNVYFNDEADITNNSLNNLINNIPFPKLILGDFNGHHPSWGSPDSNLRGDVIYDTFLKFAVIACGTFFVITMIRKDKNILKLGVFKFLRYLEGINKIMTQI